LEKNVQRPESDNGEYLRWNPKTASAEELTALGTHRVLWSRTMWSYISDSNIGSFE